MGLIFFCQCDGLKKMKCFLSVGKDQEDKDKEKEKGKARKEGKKNKRVFMNS